MQNSKPNTDSTNNSIYSCTSASRNNENDKDNVGKTVINTATTNGEGNNGEVAATEVEAEAEAATNNEKSNSSNNSIGSSNTSSKSNYVEKKILKRPVEMEEKISRELHTIHEEPNMEDDDMEGLYSGRGGDNKQNNDDIVVHYSSAVFDADYDNDNDDDNDSNKNDYATNKNRANDDNNII